MTEVSATGAAQQDEPLVTADWTSTAGLIDGVVVHDVRNVITRNGITTEVFRKDWGIVGAEVVHAIHVTFRAGALSAWHMHQRKTDHLFVVSGLLKVVLYDDREASPTRGEINELFLSHARPQLVVIPPQIFHGLQGLGSDAATFVNYFDHVYEYGDPDDHRLPHDTDQIPYSF